MRFSNIRDKKLRQMISIDLKQKILSATMILFADINEISKWIPVGKMITLPSHRLAN